MAVADLAMRFIFNLAHLLNESQRWLLAHYSLVVDFRLALLLMVAFVGSMSALLHQLHRYELLSPTGRKENPLRTLMQRLFLGWCAIYLHAVHADVFDAGETVAYVGGLVVVVVLHRLAQICGRDGLLPSFWFAPLPRIWNTVFFLLPSDPLEVVWLLFGYVASRVAFPSATGSACDLVFSRSNSFHLPGGELCSYSTGFTDDGETAVRACMDLSALGLAFAGLVWPVVEYMRVVGVRCSRLRDRRDSDTTSEPQAVPSPASTTAATAVSTPAVAAKPRAKSKRRVVGAAKAAAPTTATTAESQPDGDLIKDATPDSDADDSSTPLSMRVFLLSNMSLMCGVLTWVCLGASLASGLGWHVIGRASSSSCPTPLAQEYARELATVGATCDAQWMRLRSSMMLVSGVTGVLAAVFGTMPSPLPHALRIQVFTTLAVSTWQDSVINTCVLIATRCV